MLSKVPAQSYVQTYAISSKSRMLRPILEASASEWIGVELIGTHHILGRFILRLRECHSSRDQEKGGRTERARPCVVVQYFENAGSVSVESTPGIPRTFVTTDSRRFSRGSALTRATISESPVVPLSPRLVEPPLRSISRMCRKP